MSRILLYDETGAGERFSSDSSKHANIGTGTATDRLAVNTTTFITISSVPVLGAARSVPLSVKPTSGSTSANPGDVPHVTTTLSRKPLVTITGEDRAMRLTVDFNVDPTGHTCDTSFANIPQFQFEQSNSDGSFDIVDGDDQDPSGFGTCGARLGASVTYCYL